jgi:two-component system LytT family sensor kinase
MNASVEGNFEKPEPLIEVPRLKRFFENREAQFWVLQFVGWSGWAMAGSLAWFYWEAELAVVVLFPPAALGGMTISTGLRYLYRAVWNSPIVTRAATVLIGSYLGAAVWRILNNSLVWTFASHVEEVTQPTGIMSYFEGILTSFYLLLCWSGLYLGVKYYQMFQAETQKLLQVSAMAHQSQLKMLRYQLNPHFLFNTLNAISTLILEQQTDLANTMVMRLSSFLRYSLDSDPMVKVDMETEIKALRLYLNIEQVRFDERLKVEVELDDQSRTALVPSLLLQPLIENAIKYAVAVSEEGGTIRIDARVFAGDLLLEVSDNGPGVENLEQVSLSSGRGVGLKNIRERLQSIYGSNQAFQLARVEPHGLKICLRMPYETR